jgi:hypothetical protein
MPTYAKRDPAGVRPGWQKGRPQKTPLVPGRMFSCMQLLRVLVFRRLGPALLFRLRLGAMTTASRVVNAAY